MSEGDDDLAILCHQKALRCRDLECPENEHLGVFYCLPSSTGKLKAPTYPSDLSDSWTDLAGCYRRLGRYSAALRAFAAAHEAAGDNLPSPALCSWAQVELDLGLHEEAAEKFAIVLDRNDGIAQLQAAYGQGCALLALAQTDVQDGKGGIAFEHLSLAIDGLLESLVEKDDAGSVTSFFVCALKLLGDLYSFGANLPPDVFADENTRDDMEVGVRSQIAFIARGEEAYRAVESMQEKEQGDGDLNALWVAAVCDLGANILLQGQLLSSLNGEGSGVNNECSSHHIIRKVPEVNDKFVNATKIFQRAVDINPLFAPAWCGLGCSTTDPLLQQHAFCRALQLNKTAPEIWSNLGFLYARHHSLDASASMMDALTQVADTPLMWIGRALILERQAWASSIDEDADEKVNDESESALANAADAYRAALQVMKEPNALLGLALNCRMTKGGIGSETGLYTKVANGITRKQSHGYLNEYFHTTGGVNKGATALKGVVTIEEGAERAGKPYVFGSEELMEEGSSIIGQEINKMNAASPGAPAAFDASNFSAGLACSSIQRDLLEDLAGPGSSITGELSTAKADASLPFKGELSQARQIVHDPENGKLWLNLAKNLVGDLVSVSANGSPKRKIVRTTLESATLAADRSARFLTSQLSKAKQILPQQSVSATKPVTSDQEKPLARAQSSVPKIVHAEDVSEALSLSYWVAKVGSEMTEESEFAPKRSFDLQRSLMMFPSNALGRQALVAVSKKELQSDADQ
uniref:Uncharacterized protein n=1 Tax=Asterionellopsis glacialis TaxID=33640 RepID=A0A7S0PVA5_9STRA|mmetsp:Transcript_1007/g.1414  ORF Transcript_1007/g.1414 Transcript_1007/m.1414 type:complete len:753 (+) Transcript_1007:92-2350(+)